MQLFIAYAAGFFSCFLCMTLVSMKLNDKAKAEPKAKSKTWSKIESLRWNFDMNHKFGEVVSGQELGVAVSQIMEKHMRRCKEFETLNVDPGDYSITMSVAANFIKRD
jgi:hypothetical protein